MPLYAILLALAVTAMLTHLALLLWAASGWWRPQKHQPEPPPEPQTLTPISVIVCLRNEAHNVNALLAALMAQNYPRFEVIAVDDRSTDATPTLLALWAEREPLLRVIRVEATPEGWAPKKHAVRMGIAAARYPRLAFTDADCRMGTQWLWHMAAAFDTEADIVLGISPYQRTSGLVNALICHDTWHIALLYGGLARKGLPYMAVGRNIAYTRAFFDNTDGMDGHKHILSGDDDLIVNRYGPAARVAVQAKPDAHVQSAPPTSWKAWIRQKRRHTGASVAYSLWSKLFLGAYHISYLCSLMFMLIACLSIGFVESGQCGVIFSLSNFLFFTLVFTRLFVLYKVFPLLGNRTLITPSTFAHDVLCNLMPIVVPLAHLTKPAWKN